MSTLCYRHDMSLVSNAFGFLRFPLEYYPYTVDADWVITGVPFDITTTGRPGSRYGPSSIRQVSTHLSWERCHWPWDFDMRCRLHVIDSGDLVFDFGSVEDMSDKLQVHAEQILLSGKKLLTFGGDHYITLPLLRAYSKFFSELVIIHFDAHTDTDHISKKYNHGSVFSHILNEKLVDPYRSVQIGIRTEYLDTYGFTILDASYIHECSFNLLIKRINEKIITRNIPVYLTFDIDCLDPSVAPGTGTPVVGGLSSNIVLKLLRSFKFCNIVGMDIVEVAPAYDYSQITSLVAANIALEVLYLEASFKK